MQERDYEYFVAYLGWHQALDRIPDELLNSTSLMAMAVMEPAIKWIK